MDYLLFIIIFIRSKVNLPCIKLFIISFRYGLIHQCTLWLIGFYFCHYYFHVLYYCCSKNYLLSLVCDVSNYSAFDCFIFFFKWKRLYIFNYFGCRFFFCIFSLLGFFTPTCIFLTCVGLLLFLVVLILKRPGKLSKGIMLNKISQFMFKWFSSDS